MRNSLRYYLGIKRRIDKFKDTLLTKWIFWLNDVNLSTFRTKGVPFVRVHGKITIGKKLALNNRYKGNTIGYNIPCTFYVKKGCCLIIGNNVGISQSSLIALDNITIGDNVKIGGGSHLFTSDFHSLDPKIRKSSFDLDSTQTAPIYIDDNVFIGAECLILKGVRIGENSIIGAKSVVTKDIPSNQIWAGNPAKFIRNI